jgi:hypothetical protein
MFLCFVVQNVAFVCVGMCKLHDFAESRIKVRAPSGGNVRSTTVLLHICILAWEPSRACWRMLIRGSFQEMQGLDISWVRFGILIPSYSYPVEGRPLCEQGSYIIQRVAVLHTYQERLPCGSWFWKIT